MAKLKENMNNHIKSCPYCEGDGVVPKTWEDIQTGEAVYYKGLYIHCKEYMVIVIDRGSLKGVDYWTVWDSSNNVKFPMFKINFKGFVP
jgi:hypothetical protein